MNLSKLSKLLCGVTVCVVSGNAAANFSITNIPIVAEAPKSGPSVLKTVDVVASLDVTKISIPSVKIEPTKGPAFYVQILSLKSTLMDKLTEELNDLQGSGYSICTKDEVKWRRVLVGPYELRHAAQASAVVLRGKYADAYVVEKEACQRLFNQPLTPPTIATDQLALQGVPREPVANGELDDRPKPLYFNAHKGEGIRQALGQFAKAHDYGRVVFDMNTQDVDKITAKDNYRTLVTALSNINLTSIYNNMPPTGIYLYDVNDGDTQSLVVTDSIYRDDQSLIVFDIESGSLLANIQRLSAHYGWKVASDGWQLPVDYQIKYGYPLLVNDFFGGLAKLLKRYPVQAQLMQHTQEVAFVSRPLTANKTSDY